MGLGSFGGLLSVLGIALITANWISMALIFLPSVIFILGRVQMEEQMLVQYFGVEYEQYCRHTKRLIPWIY